jgi:Protein of unknown function (DUF3795)
MEKQITNDAELIAYCGLYCGACGKFLKDKCPGCSGNAKASWCQIRSCCIENNYKSCADCKQFSNVKDCKKYNNFIAKIFGFVFRSNRAACISLIKEKGYEGFAGYMTDNKIMTIKR